MALYLFIDSGPQKGMFFYLKDSGHLLVEGKGSDIHINNPTISAQHAQVEKKSGKILFEQLISKRYFGR